MAKDSIELALSSQPAPDVRHILPIVISYYAAHSNVSSQLWKNKGKSCFLHTTTFFLISSSLVVFRNYKIIDLMAVLMDFFIQKNRNVGRHHRNSLKSDVLFSVIK